jgi:transcription elongation GreA/GreB family factor
MTENIEIRPDFAEALQTEDWDRVEELWLEALEETPIPTTELLEIRRLIWKAGKKNLARTLLDLLAESLEGSGATADALDALRELTRLAEKKPSPEILDRLIRSLRDARADSPSLAVVLEHHPIATARRPLDELDIVRCWLDHDLGTVVEVVGKGVGRVVDLNLQLENIKVDLGGNRPASVPFGAVRRYLRSLPEGDFRRKKVEDPKMLAEFVETSPADAIVEVLESLGEPSGVAAIKAALDGLVPTSRWTSWWAKARKHPRILSSGTGSRLRYTVSHSAEGVDEALLGELQAASAAEKPAAARRLADRGGDAALAAAAVLKESMAEIEASDPGLAWHISGVLAGLPGGAETSDSCRRRLLADADPLALLAGVGDRAARANALEAIAEFHPEDWPRIWSEWFLHEGTAQLLDVIAGRLEADRHSDLVDHALEAIFRNHNDHPAQFIWACEVMTEENCPEAVRARMTPSLLEKLPDTFTRKQFSAFRGRARALLDGGRVAIRLLVESASSQQATRFSERISRIDTVEPQRARLVEQAAAHRQDAPATHAAPVLAATRAMIDAKREELRTLVEAEIPKTLKGIKAAAAEGDLRENFEYHMLRDRQELQSARAAKLQEDLAVVRILEPGAADTSTVNLGTLIHLKAKSGEQLEPVTILGVWDADLERRIYANGSDLAQRLLGCAVGDTVEVEEGPATITRIEAWTGSE